MGLTNNLRTLDTLQLAAALGLNKPGRFVQFVRADRTVRAVAAAQGRRA